MTPQVAFGVGIAAGFVLSVFVAWLMEARGVYPDDAYDVFDSDP